MRHACLAGLLIAAVLGGCAAPPVSLTPQLQKSLGSVETVAYIPQSNIDVDVVPGNAGGAGGILGALIVAAIDEGRRSSAQKASAGMTEVIADYDFRGRMRRQLDAEFQRVQSVRLQTPVRLEATDSESQRRIAYDRSSAAAVLFSRINYKLIDGKLVVTAINLMFPRAPGLMAFRPKPNNGSPLDDGNAIYRKTFTFTKQAPSRDNLRAGLDEGIANVAWQIAADINHMAGSAATAAAAQVPLAPLAAAPAPGTAPQAARPAAPPSAGAAAPVAPGPAAPGFIASGFAGIDDVNAVPFLSARGRAGYAQWLTRPTPRAFAVSAKGFWFAAWGLAPQDATLPTDPAERAVAGCNRVSNVPCRLYAVNGSVVWKRDATSP